jgi:two-component system, LuxR family, sensor histidine kinase DctS
VRSSFALTVGNTAVELPRMSSALSFIPRAAKAWRKSLPWAVLVLLVLVLQAALVALVINYEATRLQDSAEKAARSVAAQLTQTLNRSVRALQLLPTDADGWRAQVAAPLTSSTGLLRIERRDAAFALTDALDHPQSPKLFATINRQAQLGVTQAACAASRNSSAPIFSRSYFTPLPQGLGVEVIDLCIAAADGSYVVATFGLAQWLEQALATVGETVHEFSFIEADGARLARAGVARGRGLFLADQVVDVQGSALLLRANSSEGRPALVPSLSLALAAGLSVALLATMLLLARDMKRRSTAERELAQALAFRRAMEDSLITGLRARDLRGRITYVNPAFCKMVDLDAADLLNTVEPPYWPPEHAQTYRERQALRLAASDNTAARTGHETVFMRRSGERFPVLIYETPLMERHADGSPRHTGWMSAVLDLSEQRRTEERSRQQQERLQATARLATMGEMASLLSHELNQPLAAIASYAQGSLNLLDQNESDPSLFKQALERIAEQAERAGRTIKSVHDFVRRREQIREALPVDALVNAVLPLVQLQTRKSGARIEVHLPQPAPRVLADRTMIEQVLLNLTRNGLQAMESDATPLAQRLLMLTVSTSADGKVAFIVRDHGPGIAPEVAERLFTPFFTTRADGMGLGLSLCRTVIEQHGGELRWENAQPEGTVFTFTLPAVLDNRGA